MNDIDIPIQWQEGSGESVEIGCFNPNGQQCCGHCGVPGTDHGQYAYKTECTIWRRHGCQSVTELGCGQKELAKKLGMTQPGIGYVVIRGEAISKSNHLELKG